MAVLSKGNLFDPVLTKDLINKVKGKSSLAVLSAQTPIPFNGSKEFTFSDLPRTLLNKKYLALNIAMSLLNSFSFQ